MAGIILNKPYQKILYYAGLIILGLITVRVIHLQLQNIIGG